MNKNSLNEETISVKNFRIGAVTGILIFMFCGFLDVFALPHNYQTALIIRYAIFAPLGVFIYFVTFTELYERSPILWRMLFILFGQLAVVSMIAISMPEEEAYWTYYIGLILIILWAGFIFRLSSIEIILTSVTNIVFYNAVAIFFQKLTQFPLGSKEFIYYFANNFFLVTSSMCAILGASRFSSFGYKLRLQNRMLERENRKLIKAKNKAEENDMLKSAFLANMSHEIRTPMNAILGFSELLKRHNVEKDKEEKYLSIIQSKSSQLAQLIDDIIDISKIEANQLQINLYPVSIKQIFEDLSMFYSSVLVAKEKSDQVSLFVKEPIQDLADKILLDETRFTQVITNLVNNAIKFTEKGRIEIGYSLHDDKDLLVYVKDTGIGISNKGKKIIFERFKQSDESIADIYGGTGLGLSISKSLVELMGGKIWLESDLNVGTTFYFTVPYDEADDDSSDTTAFKNANHSLYNWAGKSILIVEDEPTNMEYLKVLLNDTKATLFFAVNGKEAVNVVERNKVDAVVMDLKMPVMNGFEASKKIKLKHKKLPIIAQTAYAMQYDENKALDMGLDAYIKKPVDEKKLFPVLSNYLD